MHRYNVLIYYPFLELLWNYCNIYYIQRWLLQPELHLPVDLVRYNLTRILTSNNWTLLIFVHYYFDFYTRLFPFISSVFNYSVNMI